MFLLLACTVGEEPEPFGEPCHVRGYRNSVRCGTVESQGLSLRVVVVPADQNQPETPLFLLAGGPGQAATSLVGQMMPLLERVKEDRDLVFVDQRGTGDSAPLECPEPPDTLRARLSSDLVEESCLELLDADPRDFATHIAMDDLDVVRAALGYERIQIIGASYGTRAALVYARRHPERLERMVLDGAAPPTMVLYESFAVDTESALERLYLDAPGTRERVESILAGLPVDIEVQHPRTGVREGLTLTRDLFTAQLRGLLYNAGIRALVPWTLEQAEAGEWGPFIAETTALSDGLGLSVGMHLAVVCSEDVPRFTHPDLSGTLMGDSLVVLGEESCEGWPRADLPEGSFEPVHWDGPVYILSGELDPATPSRWGDEAARTLPGALHHVISATGHGTLAVSCVAEQIDVFLEGGEPELCAPEAPPFYVDGLGP